MNEKKLRELGENLFSKKAPLTSLHQEIAENFYPERADFTLKRSLGADFAANLMTSFPVVCRRDLGNQFTTMLRPTAKPWFHPARRFEKDEDNETKQWLQFFENTQRRAMYDPVSMFTRASKEGDHDFAAFGQCAISVEVAHSRKTGPQMLYRTWHLRDMAWQENEHGKIGSRFRRWKPTAQTLVRSFGSKVHKKVENLNSKTPFDEIEVMHIVVEMDMFDGDFTKLQFGKDSFVELDRANARERPWVSIWYDTTNDHVMEAVPSWTGHYVIPRWQTVSGSQYSYSPATVAALPDARLIQAMTFTLLEAGEKATNPPMIATQDAVRSDVAVFAGGITWVDLEYDERLGDALRPISQDLKGFNFGLQMNESTRAQIHNAFFLNALTMPERSPEMTAYEVGQRIQQYIRNALPIFEPMEMEYNAALCDETFELLWRNGAFGAPATWPKKLRGADIEFHFESPLHDAIEEEKGQKFMQMKEMVAIGMALDPSVASLPKVQYALRDALNGIRVPATWQNSEAYVENAKRQAQAEQDAAKVLGALQQGAAAAADLGSAQRDTAQAQAVPA